MSFKIKNRKKKTVDNRTTIDAKHNSIVKKFKEEKKMFPNLKKDLSRTKKTYQKLMLKSLKEFSDEEFELKDELEDKIEMLESKIKDLQESKEEKQYYLDTSSLLFDYYNNSLSTKVVDEKCKKKKGKKLLWIG